MELGCRGLLEGTIPTFAWRYGGKPQSG